MHSGAGRIVSLRAGAVVRRPETLRRWLGAYAAATSTAASYDEIRDAATAGEGDKPAESTTGPYRDALARLFVLEPLAAWAPPFNHVSRLSAAPKHHLADPALAARLLGMNAAALLRGEGNQVVQRDSTLLGALFESLATLVVRVCAQAAEARVLHLRSWSGEREVDLIVERDDHRVLGLEVTLSPEVDDSDVRHLLWLEQQLGEDFLGGAVLTTGTEPTSGPMASRSSRWACSAPDSRHASRPRASRTGSNQRHRSHRRGSLIRTRSS